MQKGGKILSHQHDYKQKDKYVIVNVLIQPAEPGSRCYCAPVELGMSKIINELLQVPLNNA